MTPKLNFEPSPPVPPGFVGSLTPLLREFPAYHLSGGGVDFFLELPILGRQVKLQLNWIMALSLQVQQLTF